MYQAIVFLPLVGAILAGLIALAGARARYPGGSPEPETQSMRHEHAGAHARGHDACAHGARRPSPAEPAAAGSRAAELITTSLLFISMILSWIAFVTRRLRPGRARAARQLDRRPAISGSTGRCGSTR